jgi:D-arabinose 1-dehydrogenase-like Zn-dependent alcohol dehydrogenase
MRNTVQSCGKIKDKEGMIIAIKVSGLCEKDLLVKMNQGKERILNFFTEGKIDLGK